MAAVESAMFAQCELRLCTVEPLTVALSTFVCSMQ